MPTSQPTAQSTALAPDRRPQGRQETRELSFVYLGDRWRKDDFVIGRAKVVKQPAIIPSDTPTPIAAAALNGDAADKAIASDWLEENGSRRIDGLGEQPHADLPFPAGQEFAIKGNAPAEGLRPGNEYLAIGRFERHDKYGWGFQFQSIGETEPVTRAGVVRYLQQFKGIGPERASALFNEFGQVTLIELRRNPQKAYERCPHAFPSVGFAVEASEFFAAKTQNEATKIVLLDLIGKQGFPLTLIDRLIADHGAGAPHAVRENPFMLTRYRGVGYLKADNLWKSLGLPLDDLRRQSAYLRHWVDNDSEGNTWHWAEKIKGDARKTFDGPSFDFDAALEQCIDARQLVEFTCEANHRWVATYAGDLAERRSAARLAELSQGAALWSDAELPGLSDHQLSHARKALSERVGILTGRAGTGKTWVTARLVACLQERYDADAIVLGAPTGKAAQRMRQSLSQFGLQYTPKTIHSLLGFVFENGEGRFLHGPDNPLLGRFFIFDEWSMGDILLHSTLLRALPNDAHVLYVGDTEQLPPVGHGAPLRDMIAAGVPAGELTEVHRTAGVALQCANRILEGQPRIYSRGIDLAATPPQNLVNVDPRSASATPDSVVAIMRRMVDQQYVPSFDDIVVLTATNAVRKALNETIQATVNPTGERIPNSPFRVGDRVIFLRNDYQLSDAREGRKGQQVAVFNGEFGRVQRFGPKSIVVALDDPVRLVRVPFGKQQDEDPRDGEFAKGMLCDLGYAVTCHKCQGSSAPGIIVVLEDSYMTTGRNGLCDRAWVYTAITRTEKICAVLGSDRIVGKMAAKRNIVNRKTFFAERLREACLGVMET